MDNGNTGDLKSIFNDGIGQVQRLGSLWNSCAYLREKGMLERYMFKLDSVELELYTDLEKQKKLSEIKNINMCVVIASKREKRDLLYHLLKRKEAFLRQVQDSSGKGATYVDKSDDGTDW